MSIGSELKKAYKKSGLRDIYEKNKSQILGGLTLGMGNLATTGLAALPLISKNQADKKKEGAQNFIKDQQEKKDKANTGLDDLIDNIRGGNEPVLKQPNAPVMPTIGEKPQIGSPTAPIIPATGGITQTGGQASVDQNRLLAEAELQKKMGNDFVNTQATDRDAILRDYAALVTQQQNRLLDENTPALYEDLNTRGLLRSSELGNAMARERAKAAAIVGEQVAMQGLQDRGLTLNERSGVQNQYQQGRYGAIQRGMSLEDFARNIEAAKLTGQALAPVQQPAQSAKAGGAMQGAVGGGSIGANFGPAGAVIGAGAGGLLGGKA